MRHFTGYCCVWIRIWPPPSRGSAAGCAVRRCTSGTLPASLAVCRQESARTTAGGSASVVRTGSVVSGFGAPTETTEQVLGEERSDSAAEADAGTGSPSGAGATRTTTPGHERNGGLLPARMSDCRGRRLLAL
jgi:hypothetical protein